MRTNTQTWQYVAERKRAAGHHTQTTDREGVEEV